MIVTKEGKYKDANGNILPVVNCAPLGEKPYFRAYYRGGYYNVNQEPDNYPFDQIEWGVVEMVEDDPN